MKNWRQKLYVQSNRDPNSRKKLFAPKPAKKRRTPIVCAPLLAKTAMKLQELSKDYRASAKLLQTRLRELRAALAKEKDPEARWRLKRRIADLTPMLTEMNILAELTEHYYERGYYRNEKYRL